MNVGNKMLRITLEQWRMFKAVVEFGGFNQASQGVHKSQSSIHTSVNKIEQMLGVKLFSIEGRRTVLTAEGELMLRRAEYLLEEAAKVEAVGFNLGEGVETNLRISVDEIFPQNLLYKVLDAVSLQFPLLRIELQESVLSGAVELLENGEVDIAISSVTGNQPFIEALCHIEFLAVAHPKHVLHQNEHALSVEDLKSYRQIVVRDSALSKRQDEGWLQANQRWTVSHMKTSIDMISNGFGFAWLPVPLIQRELEEGHLLPLNLAAGATRKTQLNLLFNDEGCLGPAAQMFMAQLRQHSADV